MDSMKDAQKAHENVRSKDVTRFALCELFVDGDIEKLVSCDGHRILGTKAGFFDSYKNQIIRADVFVKNSEAVASSCSTPYPSLKQVRPDLTGYISVNFSIPSWFKSLGKLKGNNAVNLMRFGNITIGEEFLGNPEFIASVNVAYLAVLADKTLTLWYNEHDRMAPVVFTDIREKSQAYQGSEFFYVLMPMRVC